VARPGENVAILLFRSPAGANPMASAQPSPHEYVHHNVNIEKDAAQRLRYAKEKHKPLC